MFFILKRAKRLIGAIQDVSRLQELEKKLTEQTKLNKEELEKFVVVTELSFDVIWESSLLTNELFIGDGFEELFCYKIKNNKGNITIDDWVNYLHPHDREVIEKALSDALASSSAHWEYAYRFIKADGSIANVLNRASIFRDAAGKAYRMIGVMRDITERKK